MTQGPRPCWLGRCGDTLLPVACRKGGLAARGWPCCWSVQTQLWRSHHLSPVTHACVQHTHTQHTCTYKDRADTCVLCTHTKTCVCTARPHVHKTHMYRLQVRAHPLHTRAHSVRATSVCAPHACRLHAARTHSHSHTWVPRRTHRTRTLPGFSAGCPELLSSGGVQTRLRGCSRKEQGGKGQGA